MNAFLNPKLRFNSGLTLIEVLAVIAAGALLVWLFVPRGPRTSVRAQRVNCVSNLKQIGMAMKMFKEEHGDSFPWQVSTMTAARMSSESAIDPIPFLLEVSNYLYTPKVLYCPADKQRTKQAEFAQLTRKNLSYFLGIDASASDPVSILSGDRNMTGGTLSNSVMVFASPYYGAGWDRDIHSHAGNIGLADGSAQQLTDDGLRKQLRAMNKDGSRYLVP